MWHTIYNWPWATIWSAISAIFTAAAVGVAGWAMLRWSKQDELKAKQEFRKAVSTYSDALAQMPHNFKDQREIISHSKRIDDLTTLYVSCAHAWLGTEGLLDKYEGISESWEKIGDGHSKYINGKMDAHEVNDACREIMAAKFVFK